MVCAAGAVVKACAGSFVPVGSGDTVSAGFGAVSPSAAYSAGLAFEAVRYALSELVDSPTWTKVYAFFVPL